MKKSNELVLELVKYEMENDNSCELTDAIIALFTEYGLRKMVNSSQAYDITNQLLCTVSTFTLETELRDRSKRDARQL
jgi:UTP-glucose-1-phosphate uridylyltransferase